MCTNIVFGVVKVKITRRINNNLVQVDDRGTAKIIVGCGVGFNAHPGDKIDWAQVE
ncbi:CAT RNA binding domain-containing protein [Lacticaseibacillus camelliae]|uniref:CAT RNA binding domain-containing protein n=1 Tax=Lacticaseibacillus camelliae TaxID=381742 RepID=UPI0034E1EB61